MSAYYINGRMCFRLQSGKYLDIGRYMGGNRPLEDYFLEVARGDAVTRIGRRHPVRWIADLLQPYADDAAWLRNHKRTPFTQRTWRCHAKERDALASPRYWAGGRGCCPGRPLIQRNLGGGMTIIGKTNVWVVLSESGEYSQWDISIRGIFQTGELADAHVAQLEKAKDGDSIRAEEWDLLGNLPTAVTHYCRAAHIDPSGVENVTDHGHQWMTWDNEEPEVDGGKITSWHGQRDPRPDLYIEVNGSDLQKVEARYSELLGEARRRLTEHLPESPA